jgi:hypothetical protein
MDAESKASLMLPSMSIKNDVPGPGPEADALTDPTDGVTGVETTLEDLSDNLSDTGWDTDLEIEGN